MLASLQRQEAVFQNLANLQTIGYRGDRTTLTDFPSLLLAQITDRNAGPTIGKAGTGVNLASLQTDFGDGPLQLTEHPFDFATQGNSYFRVQTPGGVRYTRDGRFHRDADGQVVNDNGYRVLGDGGPISLPNGELTVSTRGEIFVDGNQVGRFGLARFADVNSLVKQDHTLFSNRGPEPDLIALEDTQVFQGYLEHSNVDAGQAVTEMLTVLRLYQANQRLVQFQDQINNSAVNQLGRV
jgi:flagellar basal-body rod protein FlgG